MWSQNGSYFYNHNKDNSKNLNGTRKRDGRNVSLLVSWFLMVYAFFMVRPVFVTRMQIYLGKMVYYVGKLHSNSSEKVILCTLCATSL